MRLELREVRLPLGAFSLEIDAVLEAPITGLFGPSGAGKTSLLDLIAGLRHPAAGFVALDGEILSDHESRRHLPPRLRRIGYVPQDLGLFPHLDVGANLIYGRPRDASEDGLFSVAHVAEVMEIAPLLQRDIKTLSGGEQQRVAFARALLSVPRLLLLDEPMSSLDSRLKKRLVPFLLRMRDEFRIPLLYVTHDVAELDALCDEVLVLERGRLVERCAPSGLHERT